MGVEKTQKRARSVNRVNIAAECKGLRVRPVDLHLRRTSETFFQLDSQIVPFDWMKSEIGPKFDPELLPHDRHGAIVASTARIRAPPDFARGRWGNKPRLYVQGQRCCESVGPRLSLSRCDNRTRALFDFPSLFVKNTGVPLPPVPQINPSILARSSLMPLTSFAGGPPPPPIGIGGACCCCCCGGAMLGPLEMVAPGPAAPKNPGGGAIPGGGRKPSSRGQREQGGRGGREERTGGRGHSHRGRAVEEVGWGHAAGWALLLLLLHVWRLLLPLEVRRRALAEVDGCAGGEVGWGAREGGSTAALLERRRSTHHSSHRSSGEAHLRERGEG